MKYLYATTLVFIFIFVNTAQAAIGTVTFDSLETADNIRHNIITSYSEIGLEFTGPSDGPAPGLFYDGQTGSSYQGSAAIYVLPGSKILTIETQPGETIFLASMDIADLCGGGIPNSLCQSPGHVQLLRIITYDEFSAIIAIEDIELQGVVGAFQTFDFSAAINGLGVQKIEISNLSGSDWQIDNFTFDTEPISEQFNVGGSSTGMTIKSVNCRNKTTKQKVSINVNGAFTDWDCEMAGFIVNPGDQVDMTVKGTVD